MFYLSKRISTELLTVYRLYPSAIQNLSFSPSDTHRCTKENVASSRPHRICILRLRASEDIRNEELTRTQDSLVYTTELIQRTALSFVWTWQKMTGTQPKSNHLWIGRFKHFQFAMKGDVVELPLFFILWYTFRHLTVNYQKFTSRALYNTNEHAKIVDLNLSINTHSQKRRGLSPQIFFLSSITNSLHGKGNWIF